jgi:hypothetical protein
VRDAGYGAAVTHKISCPGNDVLEHPVVEQVK